MSKRLLHRDPAGGLRATPGAAPKKAAPTIDADPESVVVTAAAFDEIRRQAKVEETPPRAIRVGLRGGGCSGYTYTFEWDHNDPHDKDIVIKDVDDITVYIDYRSMKLLKGTVLDYHRGLMSQGFKFHNPNSTGNCGCGESTSF